MVTPSETPCAPRHGSELDDKSRNKKRTLLTYLTTLPPPVRIRNANKKTTVARDSVTGSILLVMNTRLHSLLLVAPTPVFHTQTPFLYPKESKQPHECIPPHVFPDLSRLTHWSVIYWENCHDWCMKRLNYSYDGLPASIPRIPQCISDILAFEDLDDMATTTLHIAPRCMPGIPQRQTARPTR
jgi:hypothetical protein